MIKKVLLKIGIGIVISVILQTLILFEIQNRYIDNELKIEAANVSEEVNEEESNDKEEVAEKEVFFNISDDANNFKLSNIGDYLLYQSCNEVHILNLDNGEDNKLDMEIDNSTYFQWYENEDRLIIAKNSKEKNGFEIFTYNAKKKNIQEALDYNNEHKIYNLFSEDEKISDIRLNKINTIIYLKVQNEGYNWINRLDISGETTKMQIDTENIGKYEVIQGIDELVFEDEVSKKLYVTNNNKLSEIELNNSYLSILTVKNEKLYLTDSNKEKISNIYYKDIEEVLNKDIPWNTITLKSEKNPGKIFISEDNIPFEINEQEATITNLITEKSEQFVGTFIGLKGDKIISKEQEKIIINKID